MTQPVPAMVDDFEPEYKPAWPTAEELEQSLLEYNQNHDELGRFAASPGARAAADASYERWKAKYGKSAAKAGFGEKHDEEKPSSATAVVDDPEVAYQDKIDALVKSATTYGVSPMQLQGYHQTLKDISKYFTPAMKQKIADRLIGLTFYESTRQLTDHVEPSRAGLRLGLIGGTTRYQYWLQGTKAELRLDGGYDEAIQIDNGSPSTQEGIYVHEMGHVIDCGDISEGDAWKEAWDDEIVRFRGGGRNWPLTEYGASKPSEGFAEFIRLFAYDRERAERDFPKCWKILKDEGLV